MSWEEYKLGELCKIGRGSSPRPISNSKYFDEGDIPWVKIADATDSSKVIYKTKQHVNSYGASFSRLLPSGSLILSASGTVGFPMILGVEGCIHDGWLYFDDFKNITKEFLYYKLIDLNKYYYSLSYGGANIQNINTEIARKTKIKLPPLQTQKRIADILSAYDDLIENNLKRIKILEQAAQNIYKEWFVNLRFPGYENAVINEETGLPEGWEEKTISDVMEYKVDNRGRNPKYYTKSGIPVIDNHLIKNSPHIDFSKTKRYIDNDLFDSFIRRYLKKDDVIITLVGTLANISLAPAEKSVIIQNTIGIRCNEFCTQEYMYCFLGANKIEIQNKNRGAAQPSVKVGDLTGMKMLIPNNILLNDFSKEIKTMFSMIQTLGKQNSQLKSARDILLPRLMNRTIEVE
jgi:type I restriction enzyme S subunit